MKINRIITQWLALAALAMFNLQSSTAFAQGTTAFTYQGQLFNGADPANGSYDFVFTANDALTNGNVVGGPVTNAAVVVTNGLFTTPVDFGQGIFNGNASYLGIWVHIHTGTTYYALSPRQPITPAPYAQFAATASASSNLLGTLPAAQLSGGTASINISGSAASITGTLPVGQLGAGTANINISGNAATATTTTNVVAGITITNAFITNSIFAGNGAGPDRPQCVATCQRHHSAGAVAGVGDHQ